MKSDGEASIHNYIVWYDEINGRQIPNVLPQRWIMLDIILLMKIYLRWTRVDEFPNILMLAKIPMHRIRTYIIYRRNIERLQPLSFYIFCLFLGRRVCLGESLAKMEMFLFFVNLMQRFTFTLPAGRPRPPMDGIAGVTLGPHPYEIVATKR